MRPTRKKNVKYYKINLRFSQVKNLHMYDCLRANKSMMGWGVEARVPFLDRVFLDYAMNLDPEVKMCPGSKIEKNCLRSAFDTPEDEYLPHEILWRQKEQFSGEIQFIFPKGH